MPCKCFLVSGRVQGVFFRASTRMQAVPLGITGYARNLPDGRVEVMACADEEEKIRQLQMWLHHGPRMARVDSVLQIECERIWNYQDFSEL